ncbi:MAG TPA: response regulator [Ktedonobacterales bacterium]|jgi:DNA-binding response OmpR family regulator
MADTAQTSGAASGADRSATAGAGGGAGSGASKKILVIDDSRTIVDYVRRAIEQTCHYEVVVARNGEEGLAQLQRERPDCVVVDVMMPKVDGFQFTRVLRGDASSSQTPLIIITTLTGQDKRDIGEASGADEYLPKPFSPHDLCAAIARVMAITPEERARRIARLAGGDPGDPDPPPSG